MALPSAGISGISMPKITTEWQRFEQLSADALYEILRFRQTIFVVEQASPYLDLDGLDQEAWHLLLRADGALAGYLRLISMPGPPPAVRIGRVAVVAHLRRHRLGRRLMEEALRFCGERCPAYDIVLAAQLSLLPFYESFGFAVSSKPYDDFGVAHVAMLLPALQNPMVGEVNE
jgi:ElaA protein